MHTTTLTTLALAAHLLSTIHAAPYAPPYQNTTSPPPSQYTQIAEYTYPNFFDGFTTFNGTDPTLGFVSYVAAATAKEQNLVGWIFNAQTNSSNAFIGADASTLAPTGRSSVRLTSQQTFSVGTLTVFDILHIPVGSGEGGSGLWPAVWFLAPEPTWPYGGEIDIIEYVNPALDGNVNAMTLHTGPGCTVTPSSASLGSLSNSDCSFTDDGNLADKGCSIPAPADYSVNGSPLATAGQAFNAQGGGVYVSEWTTPGISIWLFPRTNLPADILAGAPNPASWTQQPLARFEGGGCDFATAFQPQQLIINVDICGSWAGAVFPGGVEACNAFAAANPEAYSEAYFEFASVRMYSSG